MKRALKVAIIFGGKSAEHEVSIRSAKAIVQALDRDQYTPVLFGIDKEGFWHLTGEDFTFTEEGQSLLDIAPLLKGIDIAFPVLHGPFGEDGTIQGFFEMVGIPYVGSGVLSSSICMDKEITKRLLKEAGLPIVDYLVAKEGVPFSYVRERLGFPFFIKPCSLGSSIGVEKIKGEKQYERAMREILSYDTKVLLEREAKGRELECAVLESEGRVGASLPAEIVPQEEFYTYAAKYDEGRGTVFHFPAPGLSEEEVEAIQDLSIKAFTSLGCAGMARIDFFYDREGGFMINEVNTIPGFTSMSVYPQLWGLAGLSMRDLVAALLQSGLEASRTRGKGKGEKREGEGRREFVGGLLD